MVLSRNFFLTFAQTIIKIAEIRARGFSDFPFELQLQNEIHEDEGRLLTIIGTWVVVSVNGNKMTVSANGQTINSTKYDGTPQQLMDYLNKK